MLILNSAWPFSAVRSRFASVCSRVPESATTLTNPTSIRVRVEAGRVCIGGINAVFRVLVCVSLAHVRLLQPRGGYRSPKGGTQVTLATRGETIPSCWRHITREQAQQPENPSLHPLYRPQEPTTPGLGRRVNLIAPTPFAINMAHRRSAGASIINNFEETNAVAGIYLARIKLLRQKLA